MGLIWDFGMRLRDEITWDQSHPATLDPRISLSSFHITHTLHINMASMPSKGSADRGAEERLIWIYYIYFICYLLILLTSSPLHRPFFSQPFLQSGGWFCMNIVLNGSRNPGSTSLRSRTTRGLEGGATRGNATTSRCKTTKEQRSKRTMRGRRDKRWCNNQPVRWDNERAAQWEDEERIRGWHNKRVAQREAMQQLAGTRQRERRSGRTMRGRCNKRQCNNQPVRWDNERAAQSEDDNRMRGRHNKRTRGRCNGRRLNNQLAQDDKMAAQWEDNERH